MKWFNEWFRYSAVVTLALLILILPVSALNVTTYSLSGLNTNVTVWNGTAGSTTWTVPANVTSLRYLVIGGGGGGAGATSDGAGGGGAGGFRTGTMAVTPGEVMTVVVGAGGIGGTPGVAGQNGANSTLNNTATTITAVYGGYGGVRGNPGGTGASAGGSGYTYSLHATAMTLSPMQGSDGGNGNTYAGGWNSGGGGGGYGSSGGNGDSFNGGAWGGSPGISDITGVSMFYSGGGASGAIGGTARGQGGNGYTEYSMNGAGAFGGTKAENGTINTGFGGGGAASTATYKYGGNGSAGFIAVQYQIPTKENKPAWAAVSGCYTANNPLDTNWKMVKWNATGTTSYTIPTGITNVQYLVVAGGGAGGASADSSYGTAAGGGAGGILNGTSFAVTPGAVVTVKVGAGGAAIVTTTGGEGNKGGNSSFDTIEAMGGGGGAAYAHDALSGGSGGGGAYNKAAAAGVSGQGSAGGAPNSTGYPYAAGAGGGYSAAGGAGGINTAGSGGLGGVFNITGVNTWLGGGGGGSLYPYIPTVAGIGGGSGAYGGGWASGFAPTGAGAGVAETGGGGGAAGYSLNGTAISGAGGSGVVIISYFSPPVVSSFTYSPSGTIYVNETVNFTDTSVLNPTAWTWNFTPSIGTGMGNTSTLQNPTHAFANPGTYGVTLYATNATGSSSVSNNVVISSPPLPTASFTKNASFAYLPDAVFQFNDTSTGGVMSKWQWNYTKSGGSSTQFSTEQNPVWTPTTPGTYTIVLNVSNYAGSTVSAGQTIIVNGFDAPRVSYTIAPSTGTPGALIMFNDTSTVPNTAGLVYNWSFGTGSVELNPFSDYQGSVGHVYNYGGVYNINLTISNYNGTAFNYTPSGVIISTEQRMTNWYSPHQVRFRALDANDNPIIGAFVNATAYESSLPGGFAGAQQVLIEMYGINSISASQMVSSAVQMEGYTGDDGSISFTMHGNLKYLIYVVDSSGNTYTKTIYPQMDQYLIRVTSSGYTPPQDVSDILTTQGNATLTFTEPNTTWCTMGLDYMDITSRTTSVTFTAKLLNNQTVMNTQTAAVAGTQHILLNYTVPNVRGQQWKWYYNATVV